MGSIVKEFPMFPGRTRKEKGKKESIREKPKDDRNSRETEKEIFKAYILN